MVNPERWLYVAELAGSGQQSGVAVTAVDVI